VACTICVSRAGPDDIGAHPLIFDRVYYLNDPRSAIRFRLATIDASDIRLCSVVKAELYYGAYRSAKVQANLDLLHRFFGLFVSLPFDDAAADTSAQIRSSLAAEGAPIGPYDLKIAAIAVVHGLTLVTHNRREFDRVPDLIVEDWQAS